MHHAVMSGGYRGGQAWGMPTRSPRPNFAVAKVCRIQGWKNAILKIPSFLIFKVFIKKLQSVKIGPVGLA